ncbi:MAG: glycosyltransferase family 2 protein [Rhodocyclaceae bacterium]|nr:glycosyltransferase family 2 protein [Rhodocyclaceae bacterium]
MKPSPSFPFTTLSIVCPIRDEADVLPAFFARLLPTLYATGETFEVLCINDGSQDATLSVLQGIQQQEARLHLIDFSRPFGKEAALTCGIDHAKGDAVILIDADLQDPPELIVEMVQTWRQGFDTVLAQRVDRSTDNWFKRVTARGFYRIHNAVSDCVIPIDVGDFRLMDRRVVDALKELTERHRFMKGLFAWVGFKHVLLPYVREARHAGRTKFPWWRLWNFALEGITSFSTVPLRIWTYLGLIIALCAFAFGSFIIGRTLILGIDIPGYASLITIVLMLGGIQLIGLGVLGEYLGRVHDEVKKRPLYVIREHHPKHAT